MTKVGTDVLGGCIPQYTVKHETWMGAFLPLSAQRKEKPAADPWILTGAQLAPGFSPLDSTPANRTYFLSLFPAYRDLIIRLTPPS